MVCQSIYIGTLEQLSQGKTAESHSLNRFKRIWGAVLRIDCDLLFPWEFFLGLLFLFQFIFLSWASKYYLWLHTFNCNFQKQNKLNMSVSKNCAYAFLPVLRLRFLVNFFFWCLHSRHVGVSFMPLSPSFAHVHKVSNSRKVHLQISFICLSFSTYLPLL